MTFDSTSMDHGGVPRRGGPTTARFHRGRHVRRAHLTDLACDDCAIRTAPDSDGLLGWSVAELAMISGRDLIHPDDRDALEPLVDRWRGGGRQIPFVPLTVRMLGRDQRYWWTAWRLWPSADGIGAVGVHYLGPDSCVPPPVASVRRIVRSTSLRSSR